MKLYKATFNGYCYVYAENEEDAEEIVCNSIIFCNELEDCEVYDTKIICVDENKED